MVNISERERAARQECAIKENLALCDRLLELEQAECDRLREACVENASQYRRVIGSRFVKKWLKGRAKMGRSYKVCKSKIPDQVGKGVFGERGLELHEAYSRAIASIGDSNGSSYYKQADVKIGFIADEFNYNMYADAVNAVYISPLNYRDIIDSGELDALFIMSSWRGLGFFADIHRPEFAHFYDNEGLTRIEGIAAYAKSKGLLTVFQSTEDPVDFERYKAIAKTCDYVFTSCADVIPAYRALRGDQAVFGFEYAINPLVHNPIGLFRVSEFKKTVFFAGAYYPNKFKERSDAQRRIFDGVLKDGHSLSIADRNNGRANVFPSRYRSDVMPAFDYHDLQKVHKLFDYSVNLNSVTASPTMCARRTYEVQALGGLMLSNYSLAVSNLFPEVPIVLEEAEVGRILDGHTPGEVVNMQLAGIRRMFSSCTVYDRLNRVFGICGIPHRFAAPPVYVVWAGDEAAGREALAGQSLAGARLVPEAAAPAALAAASEGLAVAWDGSGGPDYLLDMVNAFKFVEVDYVRYVGGPGEGAYDYLEGEPPVRNTMFDLSRVPASDVLSGHAASATSGFGVMEPLPPRAVSPGPKRLAVIVPVYNNGRYLEGRCFRSLLRSSVFDDMRVYLVDDGSDDPATLRAVERLAASYPNVEAFFFGDGGSGSASRPRNRGVEMCSEPYVTFLDPDNEAVNDGYARLLAALEGDGSLDFAFGPILKVDGRGGRPAVLRFAEGDAEYADPVAALVESGFAAQSMQACVFRAPFLADPSLRLVEGAVGEDTLFSYQMMAAASRMAHLDVPIHVYYADREGSEVNSVGPRFFEKSLALEREQAAFLRRSGLMGEYMGRRYRGFMEGWYMRMLSRVAPSEAAACAALVGEIAALYE